MAEGKEFMIKCTQVSWEELCDLIKGGHNIRFVLIGKIPEEDDLRKIEEVFRRVEEKRLKMAAQERISRESFPGLEKFHFPAPFPSGMIGRFFGPQARKRKMSTCDCLDCQMRKFCEEHPEEEAEDLDNQWSRFQSAMLQQGGMKWDLDECVFAISPDEIKSEAEKFGLDQRILDALLAIVAQSRKSATEKLLDQMIRDRVETFDDALRRLQRGGRLDRCIITLESGETVSLQKASEMREEIPPEFLAIIDKYVEPEDAKKNFEPEVKPKTTE